MSDTVTIETKTHDPDRGGWIVNGVSTIAGVTRRGPEFVALPETATDAELEAAIRAAYGAP
jgi:hypothetical protein